MRTMVSSRRSSFGQECFQCGHEVIAPEWTEFRNQTNGTFVHHVWHCWNCDYCFETIVNAESMEDIKTRDDIFPSLMVA
jgi:DNA-directed RNA polymerase subunit N (RpoN/RPB10)